jgi:KAP family P-loop domain
MAKYDPLRDHLAACSDDVRELTMNFSEVEELVGKLPPSARVHREWWANTVDSRVEARAWREAGWRVASVDQTAEHVTFVRISVVDDAGVRHTAFPGSPWGDNEVLQVLQHLGAHFSRLNASRLNTPFDVSGLDFQNHVAPALRQLSDARPAYITGIAVEEADYPVLITGLTERGWREFRKTGAAATSPPETLASSVSQHGGQDVFDSQESPGQTLLDSTALHEVLQDAERWFDAHGNEPDAQSVLSSLLTRADLDPATSREVIQDAIRWLNTHADIPDASFVLRALLDRSDLDIATTYEVFQIALRWLEAHGATQSAELVIEALLDLPAISDKDRRQVVEYARKVSSGHAAAQDDAPDAIRSVSLIVPAVTDDAVEGHPDRLGVDADARALAALIASRHLEPPLAVGIYGEWGSGKTFFMKRVQASVDYLTSNDTSGVFRSGVAHVWFSAWHYAEGNLWASLLHHVFASLHPGKSRHELTQDDLVGKVQGAQQVTSAVGAQVQAAATRLDHATAAIDEAKERQQAAIQESSKLRARDLWEAVKLSAADQSLKEEVIKAADDLGLSVATDSTRDLAQAARQVIDLGSRARMLAVSKPWYRCPLAYALYAAVIVGSVGLLISAVAHSANQSEITAIAQLAAAGSAVAAWVIRQASLVRRLIMPAETLQQRLEERFAQQREENGREQAELVKEADAAKAELGAAVHQHAIAEQQLELAKQEQAELTGKHLLRRYLAERADSQDYERYMGVLALAHRDLRDLDEYLRASMSDSEDGGQRLDRIVLYIDDLDRCDPDVVASVLDAVHLLLALQLFVVLVGVDPRWLKRSLRERHPVLLGSAPSAFPVTSSSDYLEKIFQLTYTLPPMSANSCADLLIGAAQDTQSASTAERHRQIDNDEEIGSTLQDIKLEREDRFNEQGQQLPDYSRKYLAEALTLSHDDITALRSVAPLVSASPRRAKRFLSVYLVIRARSLVDSDSRYNFDGKAGSSKIEPDSLLLLVALMMGLPMTMAVLTADVESHKRQASILGAALTQAIAAPEEEVRLKEFLRTVPSATKAIPMDAVLQWLPLARPYLPLGIEELHPTESEPQES